MPRRIDQKPKANTKRITFHVTHDMAKCLEKMSNNTGWNVSEIIRTALNKHMNVDLLKEDTDFLAGIVQPIVKEEIGKQANRLAAMLFKIGIISAGNYFMAVRVMSDVISPSMQEDFREISANARKLGIDYMKMNGIGVIQYMEDDEAVERATEKLKTDFTRI
jgi:predicted DNA-binding protein